MSAYKTRNHLLKTLVMRSETTNYPCQSFHNRLSDNIAGFGGSWPFTITFFSFTLVRLLS